MNQINDTITYSQKHSLFPIIPEFIILLIRQPGQKLGEISEVVNFPSSIVLLDSDCQRKWKMCECARIKQQHVLIFIKGPTNDNDDEKCGKTKINNG